MRERGEKRRERRWNLKKGERGEKADENGRRQQI
jgi:hypothetical protein